jgi:hypothetical protein
VLGITFLVIGFGCGSTVNIVDESVNEYLEHHRCANRPHNNDDLIIEDKQSCEV